MFAVIVVPSGRVICFFCLGADGVRGCALCWILLAVFLQELLLYGFRERVDRVPWLRFARLFRYRHAVADREHTFTSDEAESGGLARTIDEINPQRQIECRMACGLRVIAESEHDVGNVPAVLPETESAGREYARRTHGTHDEMHAREEMDE